MEINKAVVRKHIVNYLFIIAGSLIMAFGSVIFIAKCELVTGGISGIAVIINHYAATNVYDFVVAGFYAFFLILGFIFLGKQFAAKTVVSTSVVTAFTFIFNRVPAFNDLAKAFLGDKTIGNLILCGLFGGVLVGTGVGLTFVGGGSTGGFDVLSLMGRKYLRIKESITSFTVDAIVIVIGMFTLKGLDKALIGILSAFMVALLVDFVYVRKMSSVMVDVISNKWEEISKFAQDDLGRGATIIPIEGGYNREKKYMLRVIIFKNQYEEFRNKIAEIDPKAFICFTNTAVVFGEGFNFNKKKKKLIDNNKDK